MIIFRKYFICPSLIDDIEIHLNRTQHPQHAKPSPKSALKHPKLLKKLLAHREDLLKKIAVGADIEKLEKLTKNQNPAHYKENSLRNPIFAQEGFQEVMPNNEVPAENIYEAVKQNGYSNYFSGAYGANGNEQLRQPVASSSCANFLSICIHLLVHTYIFIFF